MDTMRRWRSAWLAIAIALLFMNGAQASEAGDAVEAVWKYQRFSFPYRSAGAVHTCSGLRSQLRSLLLVLGAETIAISVQGCDNSESTRVVHVAIASPFERGSAQSQDDTTTDLVARARGDNSAEPGTLSPFPAHWKTISFANALPLRLTSADCELLRQLQREVMPKLAVRVVSDRMRCPSDLASGQRPRLTVAALVPM